VPWFGAADGSWASTDHEGGVGLNIENRSSLVFSWRITTCGTLDAGGDARPITDRAMLSDRVLPYETRSARDAGAPHLRALASKGLSITTPTGRGCRVYGRTDMLIGEYTSRVFYGKEYVYQ
jgi:hypothetical protein